MVMKEGLNNGVTDPSPVCDDLVLSPVAPPMRISLVKTGSKKSNNTEEWELSTLESCITCLSNSTSRENSCSVQVEVVNKNKCDQQHHQARRRRHNLKGDGNAYLEVISFINCGAILDAIEIIGPLDLQGRNEKSIILAAACCSFESSSATVKEPPNGHLILFESLVEQHGVKRTGGEGNGTVLTIGKPEMLKTYPLKGERCAEIQWLDGKRYSRIVNPTKSDSLHLLMLTEQGSISIRTLRKEILQRKEDANQNRKYMYDNLETIWSYNPSLIINGQKLTCASVSYGTDQAYNPSSTKDTIEETRTAIEGPEKSSHGRCILTVVSGSNDGFLYLWKFLWHELCESAPAAADFDKASPLVPIFRTMIPISTLNPEIPLAARIVSVNFLPCPESYIVTIAMYAGLVIIWDIRQGSLDGEISTYNVHKHLTVAMFSHDLRYVLVGTTSAMCVEWKRKPVISTLSYDSWKTVKYPGAFDNLCWGVGTNNNGVYFVYDDGLFVMIPLTSLNKRHAQDYLTTYLWESNIKEGIESQADESLIEASDAVKEVGELTSQQFKMDLQLLRDSGICVTRNGSKHHKGINVNKADGRLMRNKALAHHCLKATDIQLDNVTLSVAAYGGNAGVIHLIIKY